MKLFLGIFTIALLSACSQGVNNGDAHGASDVEVKYSYVNGEKESNMAKLGVKGMACEVMCGGLIKKSLKKLEGVRTAQIKFDPDSKEGMAEVDYDAKKVTEKELVAAIEKLNEGQYQVNSVEIVVTETSYEQLDEEESEIKRSESNGLDKNISILSIPTIFQVINRAFLR